MKLYGSLRSPETRIVRATAAAVGVPVTPIDTDHPIGAYAIRELTPLWRDPAAELGGARLLGVRALVGALERQAAARDDPPIRVPGDEAARREADNLLHVVLDALAALRNAIELYREGAAGLPFPEEAEARARRALEWIEARLEPRGAPRAFHPDGALGVPEIALFCALDWMRREEAYPVHIHGGLVGFLEAWEDHPVFAGTAPPPTTPPPAGD